MVPSTKNTARTIVGASGDTRPVPVQSRDGLLPFRQDLIPASFAGHIHERRATVWILKTIVADGGGKENAVWFPRFRET